MTGLIKFDWAIKKLLRNKANFGILEGFLSELLMENIRIDHILESESNQDNQYDKYNRVDILVQNAKGELVIIEIQNDREADYLHRILFGVSKLLVNNMDTGMKYNAIKKIISVNIVYFDLGQGEDYIYHGTTNFIGLNKHDLLKLPQKDKNLYKTDNVYKIFPEYYIIKVNQFNDIARNTLDEWIYFLKNEEINENFKAKGLKEARKELSVMKLSENDRREYERWIEQQRYEHSMIVRNHEVSKWEGKEEGRVEGAERKAMDIALKCIEMNISINEIATITGLPEDVISKLKK